MQITLCASVKPGFGGFREQSPHCLKVLTKLQHHHANSQQSMMLEYPADRRRHYCKGVQPKSGLMHESRTCKFLPLICGNDHQSQYSSKRNLFVYVSQGMKAGYTTAIETQSGVCKQEPPSHQHTMHTQNAGPLPGCTQQQGALQASASSHSTPAQVLLHMQQPSLHAAPPTPVFPPLQGSLPQRPCLQGMPLQPCQGQVPGAVKPYEAQIPALVPASVPQQVEDEDVCCAQPSLPSALPHQQLAARGHIHSQMQAALNNRGLPVDGTSSSGQAGHKADQTGHATLASKATQHGAMLRAPGAGSPVSGGTVPAQNPGQGQPRSSATSAEPDKENAGTGRVMLLSVSF